MRRGAVLHEFSVTKLTRHTTHSATLTASLAILSRNAVYMWHGCCTITFSGMFPLLWKSQFNKIFGIFETLIIWKHSICEATVIREQKRTVIIEQKCIVIYH